MLQAVLTARFHRAVHDTAASRAIEAQALATHASHELMLRAGTAVARLALAAAPHARSVWVAAGPGNNGGDGLVTARLLHAAGLQVHVSLLADPRVLPSDAAWAMADATRAGVPIASSAPVGAADLVIDALLGLGATRAPTGDMADAIARINAMPATRIAVDLPSGLNADTGQSLGAAVVRATHTLALLTLKPGLFTGVGRDHAGDIWLDTLGIVPGEPAAQARLGCAADLCALLSARTHASHKGSFGDVAVVGGAPGMLGAALLAGGAALAAGAGRVFVAPLDEAALMLDPGRPELMFRKRWWASDPSTLANITVVCGCGGGALVHATLPALLARCGRLVLDADALNALASDPALRTQLDSRAARGQTTVLTPHPLEAARLLGVSVGEVQSDRLRWARELSARHRCVALLKGSGSIIAAADGRVAINPTGNSLLASGGSGDVLAGWIAGQWTQMKGQDGSAADVAFCSTVASAWLHGRAADLALQQRPEWRSIRAGDLANAMRDVAMDCARRAAG